MQKKIYMINQHLYGAILGDVLGLPYEFIQCIDYDNVKFSYGGAWGQSKGVWSDDTAMILATVDGEGDILKIERNYIDWVIYGKYTTNNESFGIGMTTRMGLKGLDTSGINNQGNGSLMRSAACYEDFKNTGSYFFSDQVCSITHQNNICVKCCRVMMDFLDLLYKGKDLEEDVFEKHKVPRISNNNGWCVGSINIAYDIMQNVSGFEDAIKKAVAMGGDTDTNASITGALAAMKFGVPLGLLNNIKNIHIISKIIGDYNRLNN